MQYKYGLDPSSKKYKCPECGRKSFVVYIDNETKAPVDEYQYGRCDKENSCNYHIHPNSNPELAAKAKEEFVPRPDPEVRQIFPGENIWGPIVNRTKTAVSPFHQYCKTKLLIPVEHLLKWGVYSDSDDLTVYAFKDFNNRIVNLKWFKYKEDGHRDKAFESFSLKQPKQNPPHTPPILQSEKKISKKEIVEKYQMCLWGEHLLPRDPDQQPVCVVESEKSAVIASFFYKQFHWVSCGSNNGLTNGKDGKPDKISHLKGRKVYWLCDADKASRITYGGDNNELRPSSVRHLLEAGIDVEIVDLFPERYDGYDIADAIMDGLRPEIKPSFKPSLKKGELQKVEDGDETEYDLPKGVKFQEVKWDIRNYMHFEHDGKIYIVRKRKGTGGYEERGIGTYFCTPITNFTIKSLGLIASEVEPTRLVEIKNIHGYSQVVKVPTKAFASPNEFTVFIESVGNFQYDGVGTDLKKLRAKLYDTMLTFEEVQNLGWHYTGYFLFANGAYNGKFNPIDKYGFVKLGEKNFFLQPLSCINRDNSEEWEDEKKFIYKTKEQVGLKEWSELFCRVHKDNGKMALAWYISSLFRDVIYQRFKFFPHLFLFGPPGTGKSQVGWSIRSLGFAGLVKPFNLNTGTAVAFHREFSHFKNFPAWCDEYSNSIPFERIQALKAAYDGVGHKKSVKDSENRTKSTQVNRAIMISGQELPIADNALFKRVVLLQFHQTEYTTDEKKLFADLQNIEEGGLSFITAGFMHFRKLIESKYYEEFDLVLADMVKEVAKLNFEVEDRIIRNSCVILTTIKVLQEKLADKLPYDYAGLKDIVIKNIKEQMSLISNTNETNTFWDMVMFLSRKGEIKEGDDYVFETKKRIKVVINRLDAWKELDKTTEVVYVRFSKIIPLYREAFKRQNSSTAAPMDKGSLIHYLQHSKPYLGLVDNVSFKDCRTSSYAFDYGMLKSMGIYLGGSEGHQGTPPPLNENLVPAGGGPDDLPF